MSARPLDEVHQISVAQYSNLLTRVSARRSQVEMDDDQDNVVDAPPDIYLTAAEFSLPLLSPNRPVSLVKDPCVRGRSLGA